MRIAGLVLAAGASSRFGSPKVLAGLDGRPLLEHVLATARASGLAPIIVVLGDAAEAVEARIAWQGERRVRNPDPGRGLSSSLRIGLETVSALEPPVDGAVVLLGDQPLTRGDVIAGLLAEPVDMSRPIVMPRYAGGGGPHPVLLRRAAFDLAAEATGDRGLGPLLARLPELVRELPVIGTNPDVDTPADLRTVAETAWDGRVAANREQAERVREVPVEPDFYAPVSALFRSDPDRTEDPFLDHLRALVLPGDTVIDIGSGAGRFALPLARRVREVIAVDPSEAMLAGLREGMDEHGIANIRRIAGRWPIRGGPLAAGGPPVADVALIAHVGYDVEPIGPFLDALEGAARRLCLAVLMDRAPASIADPFWPPVHDQERVALPAAGAFLDLLSARGRSPAVTWIDRPVRGFDGRAAMWGFLRHQLWVAPGSNTDARLDTAISALAIERDGRWYVRSEGPGHVAVISWLPDRPGTSAAGLGARPV